MRRVFLSVLSLLFFHFVFADEQSARRKVTELGGKTLLAKGRVVEVVLNKSQLDDADLALLSAFPDLTDLSLENTRASDVAMVYVAKLAKLEWLNLTALGLVMVALG